MFAASTSHADIAILNLPAAGDHAPGAAALTVTTAHTVLGSTATFDLIYTIGVTSNGQFPVVNGGATLGVGSTGTNADNVNHFATLEGNDNEGLSFTGLTLSNLNANGSSLQASDIINLTFSRIEFVAGNGSDSVLASFNSFGDTTAGTVTNIRPVNFLDLTQHPDFTSPETTLYVEPSSNNSTDRWDVSALQVQFDVVTAVPEPSALGLLGFAMIGLVSRRRRA